MKNENTHPLKTDENSHSKTQYEHRTEDESITIDLTCSSNKAYRMLLGMKAKLSSIKRDALSTHCQENPDL